MAIFVRSSAGFAWIWPYSSNPRRVSHRYGYIRPILGEFCVNMTIFVTFPAGFSWIWPYSSHPRQVLRENGHIHPILGGFCIDMAIFVRSSAGFAWIWPYLSNPRRVLGAFIQILSVPRREWIDHEGLQPQTYRVFDSMDKRKSNFWSVRVGAYCIRPKTYRVDDSMDKRESNFWSVRVGAYCIRPKTYRAGDSFAHCHGHLWGGFNTPQHRDTKNRSVGVGRFNEESNFWRV